MLNIKRTASAVAKNPLNLLKQVIASNSSTFLSPDNSVVGCESLGDTEFDNLGKVQDTISSSLSSQISGISNESASAMAQAIMTCSDSQKLADSMGSHLGDEVATESFASDSIVNNLHLTVGVAGELASANSDAGFIFPKVVVSQNTTNYKLTALRTVIEPKFYHAADGKVTDWGKLNLLDAAVKSGMLRKELNKFIPELTVDRKPLFADEAYVTPWEVVRSDGEKITTSYLGTGAEDINLISISTAKGMDRNTESTILDRIDEGAKIAGIIVAIGAAADKNAVYLSTLSANHSTFTKSETDSDSNTRTVTFNSTAMMLNLVNYIAPEFGGLKAIADIAELKALVDAGYTKIGFKVSNTYTLNLSTGTYATTMATPQVVYIERTPGVNVLEDAKATDGALLTALAAKFIGTDFSGTLSNNTLKMNGDKLGSESLDKLYPLTVRTPLEIRKDVLSKFSDADAIRMLSQGLLLRRDDETVADLHDWFNWAEATLGHEGVSDFARQDLDIIGLHYLAKPYVKRVVIKLADLLKEEDTTGKLNVLETGLVTKIQDECLVMFQESNYRNVARKQGSNPTLVPQIGLFGDSRLTNYIMRTGEDRTFGDGIALDKQAAVQATDRESMRNVIYAMPNVSDINSEQDRILGFGHSIEITPVVVKRSRDNGAAHDVVQIWPVYSNIVTMPTLLRFEIEGMDEYMSKASVDTVTSI